jgi:hypothetical protein
MNSGNMEYVCKEKSKCIIDVSRRNQCQACRLKKCLEVKMNRDGKYYFYFWLFVVKFQVVERSINKFLVFILVVFFISDNKVELRINRKVFLNKLSH